MRAGIPQRGWGLRHTIALNISNCFNMKYKGYTGVVELEEERQVLFGRVIGVRDVITFKGESVAEVIRAFHESVD
jgi:predicted HicB family RNase H-like nuclease